MIDDCPQPNPGLSTSNKVGTEEKARYFSYVMYAPVIYIFFFPGSFRDVAPGKLPCCHHISLVGASLYQYPWCMYVMYIHILTGGSPRREGETCHGY